MKTAISLPDALFRAGDALAKRMKLSRSELYARALAEFLAKHRGYAVVLLFMGAAVLTPPAVLSTPPQEFTAPVCGSAHRPVLVRPSRDSESAT